MSKHTPGPWTYEKDKDGDQWVMVKNSKRAAICRMLPPKGQFTNGETMERVDLSSENESNALLIAAAPELLEAITECLPDLEHYVATHGPGPDKRLAKLKAAIAKATD